MDIVAEGSSAVSNTPLLTEEDHHDDEEQGRLEVPSDGMKTDEEEEVTSSNTVTPIVTRHTIIEENDHNNNDNEYDYDFDEEILLPPLISFWNYVKYYGYFSRWLFPLIIINITAFVVTYESRYFADIYGIAALFLVFVLFATSIWSFYVAKLIDQQVINLDSMVQYEQANTASEEIIDAEQQADNDNRTSEVVDTTIVPQLLLNYDNIYGRVSKKIDGYLLAGNNNQDTVQSSRELSQQQQQPTDENFLLSTSCLINLSYVIWSLFLAAGFYGLTFMVLVSYHSWMKDCGDNVQYYHTSCLGEKIILPSIITAIIILMLTSCWLLIREGVESGIIPFIFAIVSMFEGGDHTDDVIPIVVVTSGTILFHIILCCCCGKNHINNNRLRILLSPQWIKRDLLIWALYGWIGAFFVLDIFSKLDYAGEVGITALVLFAFTGIVLHHPIIQLMGICTIIFAIINIFIDTDEYYDIIDFIMITLYGAGLISVGNLISRNTKTINTGCWYAFRFCRCIVLCRCFYCCRRR